jgi:DtxR family transcriptional regulator, Mn-dependent transcriptional regulator
MAPKRRRRSPAVEDYVKAIYSLAERGTGVATTNALAERLGVTPPSASSMTKKLDRLGLVARIPYRGVRLTPQGEDLALKVLRQHRLLELYLADTLGLSWDEVHDEADRLEHAMSDELEEAIAARLGHPTRDPHGDPIPGRDGQIDERPTVSLAALAAGMQGTFVRVSDADPEMLRYLATRGISPGDRFEVVERQPFGGAFVVRFGAALHALGASLAGVMRVEVSV